MTSEVAIVDVAVAVIERADGHVLLAERPSPKEYAGYWEFPGGKIESGEHPQQALARELHEELGLDMLAALPWITCVYDYPAKTVRLRFYRVRDWRGEAHGREGQRLSWQMPAALTVGPLLPANQRVLRALTVPSVYAITNARAYGAAEFLARLDQALDDGVRLIQVREPDMTPQQFAQFARQVVTRAHRFEATVMISNDAALANACGAGGVHLPARALAALTRPPQTRWWAASCHDARELALAASWGADFVVLSPVLPTPSHPEAAGIGWEGFSRLVRDYPLPAFALGGMRRADLPTAMRHGAHGIAMLSGVWD